MRIPSRHEWLDGSIDLTVYVRWEIIDTLVYHPEYAISTLVETELARLYAASETLQHFTENHLKGLDTTLLNTLIAIADACSVSIFLTISQVWIDNRTGSIVGVSKKSYLELDESLRDKHLHIWGKTGTGKSTLILNLIRQDIESGKGVCFITPTADDAERLLRYIPRPRIPEAIYFEPTRIPIGINPLHTSHESEKELVADDLLTLFKRLDDSWGPRMDMVFRFAFQALLNTPGATLVDLYSLIASEDYRRKIVPHLSSELRAFWSEFPKNVGKDANQPIAARLSKFLLAPTLNRIFSSARGLDLEDITNNRGILIVNLSKMGTDSASLLGSILVSQIQLLIRRRGNLAEHDRKPFFLYVDEFQDFVTPSFEKILSQARKLKLNLTLANQYPEQVKTLKDAIAGNVATEIHTLPDFFAEMNGSQFRTLPLPPAPIDLSQEIIGRSLLLVEPLNKQKRATPAAPKDQVKASPPPE